MWGTDVHNVTSWPFFHPFLLCSPFSFLHPFRSLQLTSQVLNMTLLFFPVCYFYLGSLIKCETPFVPILYHLLVWSKSSFIFLQNTQIYPSLVWGHWAQVCVTCIWGGQRLFGATCLKSLQVHHKRIKAYKTTSPSRIKIHSLQQWMLLYSSSPHSDILLWLRRSVM